MGFPEPDKISGIRFLGIARCRSFRASDQINVRALEDGLRLEDLWIVTRERPTRG
jgi:hypothetical protein